MRKILLALAASGLLLPAVQAQTTRGSKLLGVSVGELNYSRTKSPTTSTSFGASLRPTVAFFVADNLALGAGLILNYSRQEYGSGYHFRQLGAGLAPLLRYYVPAEGRHRVFGELGADYSWQNFRSSEYRVVAGPPAPDLVRKTNVYGYHAAVGYTYFLVPTAALEASAGFYRVAHDPVLRARSIFDVRLGFSVYLPAGGAAQN